jgi:hypothetical protein
MTPAAAEMRGSLAVALSDGENVRAGWLPPYCPELNSIERVWRDLKDDQAWQPFLDLDAPQVYVGCSVENLRQQLVRVAGTVDATTAPIAQRDTGCRSCRAAGSV